MSSEQPRRERRGHDQPSSMPPWQTDLVSLLREYETQRSKAECRQLVRVVQERNSETDIALRLWTMVNEHDSFYAAFALHGTREMWVEKEIRNAVSKCLQNAGLLKRNDYYSKPERRSHWYRRAAYLCGRSEPLYVCPLTPLALAPSNPENIELLLKAVQYTPHKDLPYLRDEDGDFRRYAAISLSAKEESFDELVSVLLRRRESSIIYPITKGIAELAPFRLLGHYALEGGVSPSKKIYQIARQRLRFGRLRSAWLAYPPRKRHLLFFQAVWRGRRRT